MKHKIIFHNVKRTLIINENDYTRDIKEIYYSHTLIIQKHFYFIICFNVTSLII